MGPGELLAGNPSGPLLGSTFAVKDMIDVEGYRTGAGNPTWLAEAEPARQSASAVRRLLEAGATCVAKTHTDEFAYSLSGINAHYGTPHNAAAPGCTPGGSSSGSAAAVAGGLVPFALGTDTGGSIRVPASYCGLFGFRPTHGAVATDGVIPLAPSFDALGWLANSRATARQVGDVLLPPDSAAPPERLALLRQPLAAVSQDVREAIEAAARRFAHRVGLPLITLDLPGAPLDDWLYAFRTLQPVEAHAAHGDWIAAHLDAVTPDVAERFALGADTSAQAEQQAKASRAELTAALVELLTAQPTALVVPSAAGPATPLDIADEHLPGIRSATLRLTCIAGLSGAPAISLPLARVNALPVGVGLIGAPGGDRALLNLAAN